LSGKDLEKTPNDIAFIPTKLLREVQSRELKCVRVMKKVPSDLLENVTIVESPEIEFPDEANKDNGECFYCKLCMCYYLLDPDVLNQPEKATTEMDNDKIAKPLGEDDISVSEKDRSIALKDNLAIADTIYTREDIADTQILLCIHGKIAPDTVLNGHVKAVNRAAAEKLLEHYQIRLDLRDIIGGNISLSNDQPRLSESTPLFTGYEFVFVI